ncbi:MotA/TolQ/ExbB proton channel family protein [Halomonas binhaiensis]|uniref:MotA/TolQ/ExbB proton channel family protein n=1 Tax=Halomonas binhaiensis TaxID=2562282 RepID=A0A5C1NDT9_9GAMM|nr:MotA/TolQ/ExbB proton channel family protein [Halomonas binhaiensis]QEM81394.1 MotA/TolQ/ExbB proton channel family protein [Halomonas binhaiensis]
MPWFELLFRAWLDTLTRFVDAGGPVLVVIGVVAMLVFAVGVERLWFFHFHYRPARRDLVERWVSRAEHASWSARTLREVWVSELIRRLRRPLPWLKLLVIVCPLLGLLGTVTGMITVFDSLSLASSNQARAMADGVARATLPTLTGMAVSVVGLLLITRLEHIIRREDQRLHDRLARAAEDAHA